MEGWKGVFALNKELDKAMQQLHEELITMGCLVEGAIDSVLEALSQKDKELAQNVINGDDLVDDQEKRIEQRCLKIIAVERPVGSDLRTVTTALKVVGDLERMADSSVDIARVVLRLADVEFVRPLRHIPIMVEMISEMITAALNAYIHRDIKQAQQVLEIQKEVRTRFQSVVDDMSALMKEDISTVDQAVNFMFVAKYFSTMSEHAGNVAEWTMYLIKGVHPEDEGL